MKNRLIVWLLKLNVEHIVPMPEWFLNILWRLR